MYTTTSSPPVDENGKEINWILGPGRVVEHDTDSTFARVQGPQKLIGIEHVNFLVNSAMQGAGVPDVAAGKVDVSVASSGIALYLELSPLLAQNAEKEVEMLGKYDQILYDLVNQWFPGYGEGISPGIAVDVSSIVSDPMPIDRAAKIAEILSLATSTPPLISIAYAQVELAKLGYEFPVDMVNTIVAEQTMLASVSDPYANRVAAEMDGAAQ
jgi:hypothetical protein